MEIRAWWTIAAACSPVIVALVVVAALREPLMGALFGQYMGFAALVVPIALQGVFSAIGVPSAVMLRRCAAAARCSCCRRCGRC